MRLLIPSVSVLLDVRRSVQIIRRFGRAREGVFLQEGSSCPSSLLCYESRQKQHQTEEVYQFVEEVLLKKAGYGHRESRRVIWDQSISMSATRMV